MVTQMCGKEGAGKAILIALFFLANTSESGSFTGGLCPELLRGWCLVIPNTPVQGNPERGAATVFTLAITMVISTCTEQTELTSCGLKPLHKATRSAS